jgi:hypothetical protein
MLIIEQYNASKAGLVQLARCLSVEWVDFCRVNCISPGFIDTDMLAVHPKEWRDKWFGMIPASRLCATYELKGVSILFIPGSNTDRCAGLRLLCFRCVELHDRLKSRHRWSLHASIVENVSKGVSPLLHPTNLVHEIVDGGFMQSGVVHPVQHRPHKRIQAI